MPKLSEGSRNMTTAQATDALKKADSDLSKAAHAHAKAPTNKDALNALRAAADAFYTARRDFRAARRREADQGDPLVS